MKGPCKYNFKEYEEKLDDIKNNILSGSVDFSNIKDELAMLKLDFKNDLKKIRAAKRGGMVADGGKFEFLNEVFGEEMDEKIKMMEDMIEKRTKDIPMEGLLNLKNSEGLQGKKLANYQAIHKDNRISNQGLELFNFNNANKMSFQDGGEMPRREETSEYTQEFFNYMQGRKFNNAMTTVETGGAVIPVSTFDKIIENVKQQTGIISKVRILNIPGKMTIPQSQIIEGATWHTEGTEISDSTKNPTNVSLNGYELAKLFSMSIATQSMSIKEFEHYLTIELTNAMSSTLNEAILTGTGTGQPTGIIQGTIWNGTNSKEYADKSVFTDLVSGMSLLASNFRQNACWFMNSTTLYKMLSKVDTNGNPIFTQGTSESPTMRLLGKEVVIDDYITDDTILFGDASYYFLNFSKPVTIQRSEEAGFTKASILYRAISVVDGKPVAPAFIKFTKSA